MFQLERKIANTAKKAAFVSGGLLCCIVGAGFFTLAAWLSLVPLVGLLMSAVILASAYLGIGLILLGLGQTTSHSDAPAEPMQASSEVAGPPIVQAFMHGLQAGAKAEQARH